MHYINNIIGISKNDNLVLIINILSSLKVYVCAEYNKIMLIKLFLMILFVKKNLKVEFFFRNQDYKEVGEIKNSRHVYLWQKYSEFYKI